MSRSFSGGRSQVSVSASTMPTRRDLPHGTTAHWPAATIQRGRNPVGVAARKRAVEKDLGEGGGQGGDAVMR